MAKYYGVDTVRALRILIALSRTPLNRTQIGILLGYTNTRQTSHVLRHLEERGLVKRDGTTYVVTERGLRVAERARELLEELHGSDWAKELGLETVIGG